MRQIVKDLGTSNFEEIIALVALYRPGPMENIPTFVDRKHGRKRTVYLHPLLETVLQETYGIPVYQEQVMQMAQKLAGYTLGGAIYYAELWVKNSCRNGSTKKNLQKWCFGT